MTSPPETPDSKQKFGKGKFLIIVLMFGAIHYWALVSLGTSLLDAHGSNNEGFGSAVALPAVVWALGQPANLLVNSSIAVHWSPLANNLVWVTNSFLWGVVCATVLCWFWKRMFRS